MQQIAITSLSKTYDSDEQKTSALVNVDLSIDEGEFVVLAGPSGSGKSTLLHIIGALDRPSSGKILIDKESLYDYSPKQLADFRLKKVGFVFQAYNLVPVLSALENVEYPLMLQNVERKERLSRAEDLLKRVGLGDQLHKKPNAMSGGQQQRVAVARALSTKPKIILADEPTANLDSKTGAQLIDLFKELNKQFGTTFIFASHDPMVIGKARRVVHLKDGKIESEEVR